jgi:phage head maturation protease
MDLRLEGYCMAWSDESFDHAGCALRIAPFAFENPAMPGTAFGVLRLCYEHDDRGVTLACTGDGSLSVWQDAFGVAFSAALDGPGGFAIADDVARGTYRHMSIAWDPIEQRIEDGVAIVKRCRLKELSLTTNPACRRGGIWLNAWPGETMPPHLQEQRRLWCASHPANRRSAPGPAAASRRRSAPVSARATAAGLRPVHIPALGAIAYCASSRFTYFNRLFGGGLCLRPRLTTAGGKNDR